MVPRELNPSSIQREGLFSLDSLRKESISHKLGLASGPSLSFSLPFRSPSVRPVQYSCRFFALASPLSLTLSLARAVIHSSLNPLYFSASLKSSGLKAENHVTPSCALSEKSSNTGLLKLEADRRGGVKDRKKEHTFNPCPCHSLRWGPVNENSVNQTSKLRKNSVGFFVPTSFGKPVNADSSPSLNVGALRQACLMPVSRSPSTPAATPLDNEIEELCNSLNKSRKRNLPAGLLRGDRVQDSLRVQEASASPLLKKSRINLTGNPADAPITPPGSEMALTMADFKKHMDENTNRRLENIDKTVSGLSDKVRGVEDAVRINSDKIDKHDAVIRTNAGRIEELRTEMKKMKDAPAHPPVWPSLPTRPSTPPRSRRTIREGQEVPENLADPRYSTTGLVGRRGQICGRDPGVRQRNW